MELRIALISGVFSLITGALVAWMSYCGVKQANNKQTALMDYRLQQLEKKVGQHNNLENRVVALETKVEAYHSA